MQPVAILSPADGNSDAATTRGGIIMSHQSRRLEDDLLILVVVQFDRGCPTLDRFQAVQADSHPATAVGGRLIVSLPEEQLADRPATVLADVDRRPGDV